MDELAEAIWGESPPATWEKALTVIASKLRGLVAEDGITLTNAFGCYRLDLPEGTWVDLFAAASGAQDAEEALAAGELDQARAAAESAESLARRPFLPGEDGTWVEQKRRDLADIRERALSVLADACLRSGAAREAAKWAEELIALSPFREAGYRRLMDAHVVAGNRAEALRVYEQCRQLLAEELGAYPSPETDSIYRALLEAPQTSVRTTPVAEPTVEPATSELSGAQTEAPPLGAEQVVERRSRKRRAVLLSALTGVIAAAVVVPLMVFGQGGSGRPRGRLGGRRLAGRRRRALGSPCRGHRRRRNTHGRCGRRGCVLGHQRRGSLGVADRPWNDRRRRHDPGRQRPERDRDRRRRRLGGQQPRRHSLADRPRHEHRRRHDRRGDEPLGIVYAAGSVWVANTGDNTIARIDPDSGRPPETFPVAATELAFGAGTLWASQPAAGQVVRVDPATGKQVGLDPGRERPDGDRLRSRLGVGDEQPGRDGLPDRSRHELGRRDRRHRERARRGGHRPTRHLGEQPVRRQRRADRSHQKPGGAASERGKPPTGIGDVGRRSARRRPSPGRRPSRRDARAAL